jgi:hypothetical protein
LLPGGVVSHIVGLKIRPEWKLDGGLAVGTRATGLAADLGDGVPVAHFEGVVVGIGGCFEGWSELELFREDAVVCCSGVCV